MVWQDWELKTTFTAADRQTSRSTSASVVYWRERATRCRFRMRSSLSVLGWRH